MLSTLPYRWSLGLLAVALLAIVGLNIAPYGWNVSSLVHMDEVMHKQHALPKGFIVLQVPSYDGAQYYQVARNIPNMFSLSHWKDLKETSPGSYAYQRFLLPLTAFIVSLGHEDALPYAFLFINILCLLGVGYLVLKATKSPLAALALTLSPTAMVALHFTLAEPLTLLLLTAFLTRYMRKEDLDWWDILFLSLVVWAREVNILFIGFLLVYSLYKGRAMDVVALFIPIFSFLFLHTWLFLIFHEIPFLLSAGAKDFPGHAAWDVIRGARGYTMYTLSAVAIFLAFVLPGWLWTLWSMVRHKRIQLLEIGAFLFFCVMLVMPDYIWGSVTSIGRVITPVYPLFILYCAKRGTPFAKLLTFHILVIGLVTAIGLALIKHPFVLA